MVPVPFLLPDNWFVLETEGSSVLCLQMKKILILKLHMVLQHVRVDAAVHHENGFKILGFGLIRKEKKRRKDKIKADGKTVNGRRKCTLLPH